MPDGVGGPGQIAVGESPAVQRPDNAAAHAPLAHDPAFRTRITLHPQSSCGPPAASSVAARQASEPKVTTADVLEALHQATHRPIVADFYTRLYPAQTVSVQNQPLFEALNQLADTMRLGWHQDAGGWLQFRSASYYDDRLKEVPNRLLARWAAARRKQAGTHEVGGLALDDLLEIAQLSDAQLDAAAMAEGARECWGLAEWDLARNPHLRPHWRYLAGFTPEQRQEALSPHGLPFTRMSAPQQQQFLAFAFGEQAAKPEELAQATVQVEYTPQGWFGWAPRPNRFQPPPVRERTREAALQAARRIDPQATETQIIPTEWTASVMYVLGPPNHRYAVCMVEVTPHGEMYGGP
jgi:hypothetical protein